VHFAATRVAAEPATRLRAAEPKPEPGAVAIATGLGDSAAGDQPAVSATRVAKLHRALAPAKRRERREQRTARPGS
jgi:hypothetical protein